MLRYREFHTASIPFKATASAFTYSGYNLISAAPLLSVLSHRLKCRRDALCSALIAGLAILLMLSLIFFLQGIYMNKIPLGELPMLTLAARQSHSFALIYGIILIFAIITTLVSSGGAMAQIIIPHQSGTRLYLVLAGAYLLSGFSFSSLVNILYRICGIAGAVIVLMIAIKCVVLKK